MKRIIGAAVLALTSATGVDAQDIVTADDATDITNSGAVEILHDWGQTFQSTPAESYLQSFTIWLTESYPYYGPGSLTFAIHEWSGTDRTGAALFEESFAVGVGDFANWSTTWFRHDFATNGLWLDPTRTYMASLRASGGNPYVAIGLVGGGNAYPGAIPAIYHRNHGDNWSFYADEGNTVDLAMIADFSASQTPTEVVPEPITMILLGSGLAGVGAVRRRRRESQPAA